MCHQSQSISTFRTLPSSRKSGAQLRISPSGLPPTRKAATFSAPLRGHRPHSPAPWREPTAPGGKLVRRPHVLATWSCCRWALDGLVVLHKWREIGIHVPLGPICGASLRQAWPQHLQREVDMHISLGASLLAVKGYAAREVGETYTYARQLGEHLAEPHQLFPILRGLWWFCPVWLGADGLCTPQVSPMWHASIRPHRPQRHSPLHHPRHCPHRPRPYPLLGHPI